MSFRKMRHLVYIVLYSLFWCALAVIAFRALFVGDMMQLRSGPFFFITGLFYLICACVRALSGHNAAPVPAPRDPVVASFGVAGLLLIAYANFV